MAQPGRKPKPPALKILEGNPGHRSIPDAPKPPPRAPKQPSWGSIFALPSVPGPTLAKGPLAEMRKLEIAAARAYADEVRQLQKDAAAEWRAVVPVLDHQGLLATVDRGVLIDYCLCWARLLECERAISREGLVTAGQKGAVRNPKTITAAQYRAALRNYRAVLGLSPSDRGRLAPPGGIGAAEDSPWDA